MNGFTFFENYYRAIKDPENELTEVEQGRLYNAIFAYMFENREPELKGACKMAFNLIRPALDRSKRNGKNGSKPSPQDETEIESNGNGIESNRNEIETESTRNQNQKSAFLEEVRSKKEEVSTDVLSAGARVEADEADETVKAYKAFLRGNPAIIVDLTNPSEIMTVDWALLGAKIRESRFLQTRRSLKWLIVHYQEIVADSYKDFPTGPPKGESAEDVEEKFKRDHPWLNGG